MPAMDVKEAGKRGGASRARKLSAKERKEIARLGGLARWNKPRVARRPKDKGK